MTLAAMFTMLGPLCLAVAHAQSPGRALPANYPDRPVRLIVPVAAGGGTDIVARIVAAKLGDALGQQLVVDNRPGAGGIIGTDIVARAAPDGFTLLFAFASHTTTPLLVKDVPYDPVKSFTPITLIATSPLLLIVPVTLPPASVEELIAYARARPGRMNVAVASAGSAVHIAAEQFKQTTSAGIATVFYKGAAPALIALIGGEAQMMFATVPAAQPFFRQGKVRVLATANRQRLPYLPEVPTLEESGLKGFDVAPWQGLLGPRGLALAVVERLHAESSKVLRQPELRERLAAAGSDAIGSTPAEFSAHLRRETEWLGRVIRAAGMRAE